MVQRNSTKLNMMHNTISVRYIMKKGIHAFKGRRAAREKRNAAIIWGYK